MKKYSDEISQLYNKTADRIYMEESEKRAKEDKPESGEQDQ